MEGAATFAGAAARSEKNTGRPDSNRRRPMSDALPLCYGVAPFVLFYFAMSFSHKLYFMLLALVQMFALSELPAVHT